MIVMCSSPLLMLEFRTDASGRKSFTMGRNPLERGGISQLDSQGEHEEQDGWSWVLAVHRYLGSASRLEITGFLDTLTSGT